MCSFSGFDMIWFFILQNFMEFIEMQYALVVYLIGFFGIWAIVLGHSCLKCCFVLQNSRMMWEIWLSVIGCI